ncbi:hypothetical protein [Burkholderia gladioli]|uniref:hypothetical protein n=1 Tax=Burkholderia gladioli TaxID=28095 RepID=UPI001641B862|nr:hypothetical protein [Burkholderia gladioli]
MQKEDSAAGAVLLGVPANAEIAEMCATHGLGPNVGTLVVREALRRWGVPLSASSAAWMEIKPDDSRDLWWPEEYEATAKDRPRSIFVPLKADPFAAYELLVAGQGGPDVPAVVVVPAEPSADGVHAATSVDRADFKNFHRLLCERFGYVHDEVDWQRDQLSLIEHIARQLGERKPAPFECSP